MMESAEHPQQKDADMVNAVAKESQCLYVQFF